jgi:replicative DNA helicase
MSVNQLIAKIKSGRQGKNIGISTGNPKLDSVIFGIQRRYLYVVAADLGSGKTSYAIDVFVYNLLKNRGDRTVNILYYSFEMSSDVLYAKILALHIYHTYGKIITYETILSLTSPISDEEYDYIKKSVDWLKDLQEHFTIYDKSLTPNGIYATCKEWLKRFGEFVQVGEHKEDYIEADPDQYKVVLIDHMGLIGGPESKKQKMDTTTDYLIYFRNKCNISGVLIQQINRNSKSMDRRTNGYELLQLDDLSDSSGPSQGAEIVIMLYYPFREKVARCEGYNIQTGLKHRGRIVQIVKNRYGRSEVNIGAAFFGEIGMFKELPRPDEIGDYEKYTNLNPTTSADNENIADTNLYTFKL